LTHALSIWLAFDLISARPLALRVAVFAASTVGFAWAAYRLVEVPGQRMGKRLAEALQEKWEKSHSSSAARQG
jgi:peptidoglycan/LPS O-acetylase OafA/YrhL